MNTETIKHWVPSAVSLRVNCVEDPLIITIIPSYNPASWFESISAVPAGCLCRKEKARNKLLQNKVKLHERWGTKAA